MSKKITEVKTNEVKNTVEDVRILKTASTVSLSGRSELTYHVGCQGETIYIRLYQNSGSGIFSKQWVPLTDLDPLSTSEPMTSGAIRELFKGKSVNTAGFLISVLIAEGLLRVADESLRTYVRCNPVQFKKSMQALMELPETVRAKTVPAKTSTPNSSASKLTKPEKPTGKKKREETPKEPRKEPQSMEE